MKSSWIEHLLIARISLLLVQTRSYPSTGRIVNAVVPTDRLIWLKQGSLTYKSENSITQLSKNDFRLVPAWTRREWQVSSQRGCTMAWVEFVILDETMPTPPAHVTQAPLALQRSLASLLSDAKSSQRTEQLYAEMQLKWLLMQMVRLNQMQPAQEAAASGHSSKPASKVLRAAPASPEVMADLGLSSLITFMHKQLHDPKLLAKLPDHASLSPGRFRSRFLAATGQSPGRYLQALRMQRARYLLLTTDLSVKQIAGRTGFDDPLYFSRRYRAYWGSPATHDRAPSP